MSADYYIGLVVGILINTILHIIVNKQGTGRP